MISYVIYSHSNLIRRLSITHLIRPETNDSMEDWRLALQTNCIQQSNGSDCGIFTIKFGELLLCQIDPRNSNQYSFNPNEVDLPIGKKIKLPNRARTPSKALAAKQMSMKKAREVKP